MAGRFPGARTVDQLWSLLAEGRSAIAEIPASRWDWRDYYRGPGDSRNEMSTNQGGFVEGWTNSIRCSSKCRPEKPNRWIPASAIADGAYRAIEDAGISPGLLRGPEPACLPAWRESVRADDRPAGDHDQRNAMIFLAALLFPGSARPAIATNTACSSGLVACTRR